MEGVAARLGRSSTRYGPAAVFSGPVRRWNKKWVPLSSPDHHRRRNNGANPHLLLYRWTPVSSAADGGATTATPPKDSATPPPEEPPRRKFRYIPVTLVSSPSLSIGCLILRRKSSATHGWARFGSCGIWEGGSLSLSLSLS